VIKLIASDMDGTLVTGHIDISETTRKAIKKAQELGIHFVAATGRNYQEASIPLKNAGIVADIIGVNGAAVFSSTGEILETNPINKTTALAILDLLDEYKIYYEVVGQGMVYSQQKSKRLEYFASHITDEIPHLTFKQALAMAATRLQFFDVEMVDDMRELIHRPEMQVLKIFSIAQDGDKSFRPVKEIIAQRFPDLAVSSSGNHNMEITDIHAQKGVAVKKLAERLGISADEVMTIGDSYNDLSMLEYAGVSFAMGNANEDVKQHAKYVTDTNEEDGVGKAIMRAIEEKL